MYFIKNNACLAPFVGIQQLYSKILLDPYCLCYRMSPKTCCIQTWLNPLLRFLFFFGWLPWKPNCKEVIAVFVAFGGAFLVWFQFQHKILLLTRNDDFEN